MKRVLLVVMAMLIISTGKPTDLWSGESLKFAQSKHMDHDVHGTKKSHGHPMGGMDMKGMEGHKHHDHQQHHKQMNIPSKMPPHSALKPAEGARVKILSPKNGDQVRGNEVELHFELVKGKRGNHVHAYVDEELMGMFGKDEGTLNGMGTLTGIRPGHHTLELRVVTKEHNTELDAIDRVKFMVK